MREFLNSFIYRAAKLSRLSYFSRKIIIDLMELFLVSLASILFYFSYGRFILFLPLFILFYPRFCICEQRLRSIGAATKIKYIFLWALFARIPILGMIIEGILILTPPKRIYLKHEKTSHDPKN